QLVTRVGFQHGRLEGGWTAARRLDRHLETGSNDRRPFHATDERVPVREGAKVVEHIPNPLGGRGDLDLRIDGFHDLPSFVGCRLTDEESIGEAATTIRVSRPDR